MKKLPIIFALLVIVCLISLRFVRLNTDPPILLAQHGQSALTDPYLYTWHARQAALFPSEQQVDNRRFAPLKFTAVSAVARVVFAIAGVSRVTANIASILLSLGGILLWLAGLRRFWDWPRLLVIGLLCSLNFVLFTYGRMPYLENGLIFLSGLTFFVHVNWGERALGQVLTGIVIAAAALCGKLFGVLLFVPVTATTICLLKTRSFKAIGLTALGALLGAAGYLFLFLDGDYHLLWQYYTDTTNLLRVSVHFHRPFDLIGMFVNFGGEGGLILFAIGSTCIAAGGSIFWLITRDLSKLKADDLPVLFSISWLAVTLVVFLPFEFRPLRYFIVGVIPALTLISPLVESWRRRLPIVVKPLWLIMPLVFVIMLLLTYQVITYGAVKARAFRGFESVLPYGFVAAVGIMLVIVLVRRRNEAHLPRNLGRAALVVILGWYLWTNGDNIVAAMRYPRHDLQSLSREVSEIINPSALVSGSYAPALTIDNKLNGVFNYLGTVRADTDFFATCHPTHLLTNSSDWVEVIKDYPFLRANSPMITPLLWQYQLAVVRLPSAKYSPTLFEQALDMDRRRQLDSARLLLNTFCARHPNNRLPAITRINFYSSRLSLPDSALRLTDELVKMWPDDYFVQVFASTFYRKFNLLEKSHECVARSNRLNPYLRPQI